MTDQVLTVATVFFYGLAVDVLWIKCTQEVTNKKRPVRAGLYSVALATPGLLGFVAVSEDLLMAIPYLLGLFTGTILSLTVLDGDNASSRN